MTQEQIVRQAVEVGVQGLDLLGSTQWGKHAILMRRFDRLCRMATPESVALIHEGVRARRPKVYDRVLASTSG